jgi:hypothetical protein
MKTRILDSESLSAVTPAALRAYASFEGWRKLEAYGQLSDVYNRVLGDRSVEVIIPATNALGDYASVVSQLISIFSRESGRDELAVFRDLTHADRDVIRVRSPDANDDGSITLNSGVLLIEQARNMLAASACSAIEPKTSFRTGKIQRANEYMDRVRLGQTEAGSFVVALLAPVPPTLSPTSQSQFWPEIESEPYDRQVTRVFAQGLESAAHALTALNRGDDISAFESAVKFGLSANLCEAIAAIAENGNGADISVTWARTRPTPIERSQTKFSRSDAEPLREVARQFRLKEPRNDQMLFGVPTGLKRKGKQNLGRVTFTAMIDDKPRSVTVELIPAEYDIAVQAHKRRQPIVIIGDLIREGQRWHLRNPREVATTAPES